MLLIKWDIDGNQIWNRTWDGTSGTSSTYCKGMWGYGSDIYTVGYNGSFNSEDLVIVKWDSDGNNLWANSWGTSESDKGYGVWADDTTVYTTGSSNGLTADFKDMVIVKWNASTGEFLANNSWDYTGDGDAGNGIWGDDNYVYTCGYADTNANDLLTSQEYALVKWDRGSINLVWNYTYPQGSMEEGKDLWGDQEYLYMFGTRFGKADLTKINITSGDLIWSTEWDAWEYGTNSNYGSSVWGVDDFLYTCGNAHKPSESNHNITIVKWDMLGKRPNAAFSFNDSSLISGQFIQFLHTGSEGDDPIYEWDFGDGSENSTVRNPIHQYFYSFPGVYSVTLSITDADGETSRITQKSIIAVLEDLLPTANFTASQTNIYQYTDVEFSYIGELGNYPTDFQWNFDDSPYNVTEVNPTHQFRLLGDHTVGLTVTDSDGDIGYFSMVITVSAEPDKIPGYPITWILSIGLVGVLLISTKIKKTI
jgi:PKD repeat protein